MRSFVLRLVDSALSAGCITGQVEAVQTGHVHVVGDAEDLIAFLLSTAATIEATDGERRQQWDTESQPPNGSPGGGY
jgi:hypothetical protein